MVSDFPLVCICVPTYNAATTVHETLKSILAQTYPNIVVHLSDNASTDETIQVVEAIVDSRVHIHRNEVNVGGEANFNRCIELAEGKYTAIFHADDVYEPTILTKQVQFLESHSEAGAVFTEASLIDDSGKIVGSLSSPSNLVSADSLYKFPTIFKSVLQYSNFLICPSVMVRTDVYKYDVRRWRGELFRASSDLDVWFRILQRYTIGIIPEKLMRYRISVGQHSEMLRSRTARSDFFLVIDYYLKQKGVQVMLSHVDWLHYRWLERTDRVVRAVNYYLLGDERLASVLCYDALSFDAFYAAAQGVRGLITFSIGTLLKFFIFFHLSFIGIPLLRRLKHLAGK